MNKQRLGILILASIGVVSLFLPWVSMPFVGSVTGLKVGGMAFLTTALYAIPLVICLIKDREKSLSGNLMYAAIAPAILAAILGVWKLIEFNSVMSKMESEDNPFAAALSQTVSVEVGLYLVVLAGIAMPLAAFLIKEKAKVIA